MDELLQNAPCGFLSVRDDGTIVVVNETFATMLGHPRVQLAGKHVQSVLTPGSRVFYQTHVFPLLRLRGMVEELYLSLRTSDGADLPVLLNGARRERSGETHNDFVVVRMRQRALYEEELLQAKKAAEAAAAAKAKFLSMVSHDLRTPLTAIAGYADVVATGMHGPVNDEQRDDLRVIKNATLDLSRMIGDILSFAQLESGRVRILPARVAVADALRRAEELIAVRLADAQLTMRYDQCDDGELAVIADADRLQQVLLNLLTNAVKFTPPGGSLTLRCERSDDRVRIHVADTGVGIPADALERIFSAFVQLDTTPADPSQRGVGLGLAISRDLVRAMGGELTASSRVGEGSVFTIDLPAAAATTTA